jgi:hypothetical protein
MRRALIGIGLCVALAAPATASGVEKTFAGKVNSRGKIGITADVVDRHAVEVTHMRLKRVRIHCSNGGGTVSATFNFNNLFVNGNNRFIFDKDYSAAGINDAHLLFKGTFKRHAKRVEGSLKDTFHDIGTNQDCNTGKRGYEAKRGPLPKAPKSPALRLAP